MTTAGPAPCPACGGPRLRNRVCDADGARERLVCMPCQTVTDGPVRPDLARAAHY